ncbi:hypothetical protein ES319_D10G059400v1 [Gossypium barbadense]|uniref:Legumain prodomain domain-containing protein n=1 Tax=Gossypium barbadense TaxID=3634 RepID=A0A5J5PRJ2_GOSBA|nr:hypothetical protein ES319_D10G059400v1 [Gossypium barbadense]
MTSLVVGAILLLLLLIRIVSAGRDVTGDILRLPSEANKVFHGGDDDKVEGSRWAVLIAGSNGYWNYRYQADICHAYQLLRNGGLKEENIIAFMYDDIAYNEENPRPGIIINNPHGNDVYKGVPKDYTGENVTVHNFFAAILGNKSALTGGSGKVVNSGPNDHIFIYYSDHGGPCVLACESGSIFEGLLPEGLNIYATTAANAVESSWGTYCPGEYRSPPPEYETCLGDLYSVAWMEDSDIHNLRKETLHQQYELVKRTINDNSAYGSHVMQFAGIGISMDNLFTCLGTNPANDNFKFVNGNSLLPPTKAVNQRNADLAHFWDKYRKAPDVLVRKVEAQKQVMEAMSHRMHVDKGIQLIGKLLFGVERGPEVLNTVRPAGQPLSLFLIFLFLIMQLTKMLCSSTHVRTFETHCGSLAQYGMKHMRSLANICNAGIETEKMGEASAQACFNIPSGHWGSLGKGFSA